MKRPRVHYGPIDSHAHAIGYVCITWAVLETELDKLIIMLAPLEYGEPGEAILGHSNIRDKIKMLKALAFIRKPDTIWYEQLEKLLNVVDYDYRPKRNQYIHDLWIETYTATPPIVQVSKRTRGPKVVNVQSRTKRLELFKDVPTQADEIWDFASLIRGLHPVSKTPS